MSGDANPTVLALNSGSSSLKFGLYSVGSSQILATGEAELAGGGKGRFRTADAEGVRLVDETSDDCLKAVLAARL